MHEHLIKSLSDIIKKKQTEKGVPPQSFPVRHLVDACVVRMFIFLSFNEDAALIR